MNTNCFSPAVHQYLYNYNCILDAMINKIDSAKQCESISYNFISRMLPHHEAAIKMCENVLKYTTDKTLICICKNIIAEQTKSIADMLKIQEECGNCKSPAKCLAEYECVLRKILDDMFCSMRTAEQTDCINCNFLREMIPHHEGAVYMSENLLKYEICSGLVPIAKSIIIDQKNGIKEMKKLSCTLKCK